MCTELLRYSDVLKTLSVQRTATRCSGGARKKHENLHVLERGVFLLISIEPISELVLLTECCEMQGL